MGGNLPRVSVLLSVRDGLPWLPWTWNTLRRALDPSDEVVAVDDGSGDGTGPLLDAWAEGEPRLRVLHLEPTGLAGALNVGLAAARAPFVARVDADDLVTPGRFTAQLDLARAEALDVVGSAIRCFPARSLTRGLRRYEAWQNELVEPWAMARDRFVESPLVHPSVLVRREAVRAVGGYRACGWPEDYDLWLRLWAAGARFGKHPAVLTWWRDHPARLTRTAAHCAADAVVACKVHHLLRGPLAAGGPAFIAGAGDDAKRIARRLAAEGCRVRGFLDLNPRRIGQSMLGAPVVTLEAVREQLGYPAVVLVAIGEAGRRPQLRRYFGDAGLEECRDFWFVA